MDTAVTEQGTLPGEVPRDRGEHLAVDSMVVMLQQDASSFGEGLAGLSTAQVMVEWSCGGRRGGQPVSKLILGHSALLSVLIKYSKLGGDLEDSSLPGAICSRYLFSPGSHESVICNLQIVFFLC